MEQDFAVIVLAAGEGKRMKSSLSKVLHPIGGEPMITRSISIIRKVNPKQIIIVASPQNVDALKEIIGSRCTFAIQEKPLGTAHAARCGLKKVFRNIKSVAIMYGDDTAFYKPQTIVDVFHYHNNLKATITFVTLEKENPTGFGRILRKNGKLTGIVEEKDTTASQKLIKEINDGLYFFDKKWLLQNLSKITLSSVTGELYLSDLIALALAKKKMVKAYKLKDTAQWHGINTPEELALANARLQIHIMGIAGAGASAVAAIAKAKGFEISGCDLNPHSSYSTNLSGIYVWQNHSPSHLRGITTLVVSPAVLKFDPKNEEIKEGKEQKIPVLTWQKFQGNFLQKDKFVIAVAGAYGKSTTTAMISKILMGVNLDPTCEIGATIIDWGKNYRAGNSKYYICEADEYNNNFLNYQADIAVILNIDWDHPDFFKSNSAVFSSYRKFIGQIKTGATLVITDDPKLKDLAKSRLDIKIVKVKKHNCHLSIIGDFRKENADAALTVAEILGLDLKKAQKSVADFKGLKRRLEYKGTIDRIKIYDDYAVQPFTILTTANALKAKFKNKKVVLVFEPHTFSRINTFFDNFVQNLKNTKVDQVLITNIYPAREHGDRKKVARKLAKAIGPKAQFTGSVQDTARYLLINIKNFDVILSMGAGDVYKLYDKLLEHYQKYNNQITRPAVKKI